MKDSFYIPKKPGYMASISHLSQCNKCQRKFLVSMGLNGTVHHTNPSVVCLDCLVVEDKFAEEYPEIAAQIAGWKSAS